MANDESGWDAGRGHAPRGGHRAGSHDGTGRGRSGWGGPRRMRRGDIRVFLLAALLEGPAHGYELMGRLEARSNGAWRPSPGSVYPTLQLLEEQGLIRGREDNGKRIFELSDAGRIEAEAGRGQEPTPPEGRDQPSLRAAVEQLSMAARQVAVAGNAAQVDAAAAIVRDARQHLYRLLAEA